MNAPPLNKPSVLPGAQVLPSAAFDQERLDAYHPEPRFIPWAAPIIEEAKQPTAGKTREVCDQLDRASLSTHLNTPEGSGDFVTRFDRNEPRLQEETADDGINPIHCT